MAVLQKKDGVMNGLKTKSETDPYLIGMILLQIALGLLLGVIVWFITGLWIFLSIIVGIAVWSTLLLGSDMVNIFFVEIAEFAGAVIINQFKSDKLPTDAQDSITMLHTDTSSVREVSSGYHGKWPWERVVAVELKRHIVITSTIKAYTKDNIEVSVEWVATLTPLKGYLVNYLRWSDEARKAYFEGSFQAHILATIKTLNEEELFGEIDRGGKKITGMEVVKDRFNNIFGGKDKSSPDEEKFGTFTNSPTIKRIERSENYRKAAESVKIAQKTNDAIRSLGDIDPKLATAAVLGMQGIETVKTFQFIGDIKGLENLQTIMVPGAGNIPGDKDKGKGK